jgi:hypothetical protein
MPNTWNMFYKINIFKAKKNKFYVNWTKGEFTNLKMDFIGHVLF